MFFGGEFSHATVKRPAPGDFRVQPEYGGTWNAAAAPRHFVEAAQRALATVGSELLYARVDGIDADGELMIMELELLEPHLFFAEDARAAGRFADALERLAK